MPHLTPRRLAAVGILAAISLTRFASNLPKEATMSVFKRWIASLAVLTVSVVAAIAPSSALARSTSDRCHSNDTYGATSAVLAPSAEDALSSSGVSLGLVGPAYVANGALDFPIKTPLLDALATGRICHSGGISFTKGATVAKLTDLTINAASRVVTAQVNGGARVPFEQLDYTGASLRHGDHQLSYGPITATLTSDGATLLNGAFGTTVFTEGLVAAQLTITYQTGS
jgi:hypothetical protein